MDVRSTLFNLLSGGPNLNVPGPFKNFADLMTKFNEYRNSFQGDPFQQADNLRNSGQMTDETYNKLAQIASPIYQMLRRR